jgi:hypothetical protein
MKLFFLSAFYICFTLDIAAQSEFGKKPINSSMKFPIVPKNEPVKEAPKFKFEANAPLNSDKFPSLTNPEPKPFSMMKKNEFINPNKQIVEKLNRGDENVGMDFKSDRYLGDFRNNGKFVRIVCRDYGEVDGDRVRVYLNDHVIEEDVYLTGSYREIKINLVAGFNKVGFQALNQGLLGPNTAELQMYDDKGVLITSNQWVLATGIKASLIIVKE